MKDEFNWIKEQFELNPNERKGIFFFLILYLVLSFINISYEGKTNNETNKISISEILQEVEHDSKPIQSRKEKRALVQKSYKSIIKNQKTLNTNINQEEVFQQDDIRVIPEQTPIRVNPNRPKRIDLEQLGINSYAINSWSKYLDSGATFKEVEDLKKIYGLREDEYVLLKELLIFDVKEKPKSYAPRVALELNSANANDLKDLRGIGPVLSERILKYRNGLGGFVNKEQLKEVYGISDSLFVALIPRIKVLPVVSKININKVEFKELLSHPYVDYKMAKKILRYRLQHGDFVDLSKLHDIKSIETDKLSKLLPYLSI